MDAKEQYYLSRRFIKDDSIVSRVIAGERVLAPIRRKSGEVTSIYTLNEVGGRIWDLLDGSLIIEEISARIREEYEVSEEDSRKDVVRFVAQLETLGAVRAV